MAPMQVAVPAWIQPSDAHIAVPQQSVLRPVMPQQSVLRLVLPPPEGTLRPAVPQPRGACPLVRPAVAQPSVLRPPVLHFRMQSPEVEWREVSDYLNIVAFFSFLMLTSLGIYIYIHLPYQMCL